MPTSAPGNRTIDRRLGFTLIEVMVVLAVIAIGVALVSIALRDPAATRLEREAERLAALLEMARAESRVTGLPAGWFPARDAGETAFRFVGLRKNNRLPERWLDDGVRAQVVGGTSIVLGPDAILPPQRVLLALESQRVEVATDGLGAFTASPVSAASP